MRKLCVKSITTVAAVFLLTAVAVADDNPFGTWGGSSSMGDPSSPSGESKPVTGDIVKIDTSNPDACEKFKKYMKENKAFLIRNSEENGQSVLELFEKMQKQLEKDICDPDPENPKVISLLLFKKPTTKADPNPQVINLDLAGGYYNGDREYGHFSGTFSYDKKWMNTHQLLLSLNGQIESDKIEEAKLVLSTQYNYMLTNHWALFAVVTAKMDRPRDVWFGSDEIVGALYNIFPFSDPLKRALSFSVGVGHRFEYMEDNTYYNDSIMSYRIKLEHNIIKQVRLMSAIWFQHMLASKQSGEEIGFFDVSDYRIFAEIKLKIQVASNVNVIVGVENEYFSKPRNDGINNIFNVLIGVGFKW